jgi:hypothetical protein
MPRSILIFFLQERNVESLREGKEEVIDSAVYYF